MFIVVKHIATVDCVRIEAEAMSWCKDKYQMRIELSNGKTYTKTFYEESDCDLEYAVIVDAINNPDVKHTITFED